VCIYWRCLHMCSHQQPLILAPSSSSSRTTAACLAHFSAALGTQVSLEPRRFVWRSLAAAVVSCSRTTMSCHSQAGVCDSDAWSHSHRVPHVLTVWLCSAGRGTGAGSWAAWSVCLWLMHMPLFYLGAGCSCGMCSTGLCRSGGNGPVHVRTSRARLHF
jgi:hypothetical protein